jgi:hypothetical protein
MKEIQTHVLREAHRRRTARGDHPITDEHLADAVQRLVERDQETLSPERGANDPATKKPFVLD